MGKMSDDKLAREAAWTALEAHGYDVTDVSSGSGVPRGSRLHIRKNGRTLKVAVKKATQKGRFSFQKDSANRFNVLPEIDLVLHVQPKSDGGFVVSAFDQHVVLTAFETAQKANVANGLPHIPCWVNPHPETRERYAAGSGFIGEAIWSNSAETDTFSEAHLSLSRPANSGVSLEDEVKALIVKRTGHDMRRVQVQIRLV